MTPNPTMREVCSLPSDQLEERLAMIRREILPHVARWRALANGLVWEFAASPETRAKLEQLVALERQCCGGLRWELREDPDSARLRLSVEGIDPRSGALGTLGDLGADRRD